MARARILNLMQRSIKQQGSYKIAANFKIIGKEYRNVPWATFNLDQDMQTLWKNEMELWLKIFLKQGPS